MGQLDHMVKEIKGEGITLDSLDRMKRSGVMEDLGVTTEQFRQAIETKMQQLKTEPTSDLAKKLETDLNSLWARAESARGFPSPDKPADASDRLVQSVAQPFSLGEKSSENETESAEPQAQTRRFRTAGVVSWDKPAKILSAGSQLLGKLFGEKEPVKTTGFVLKAKKESNGRMGFELVANPKALRELATIKRNQTLTLSPPKSAINQPSGQLPVRVRIHAKVFFEHELIATQISTQAFQKQNDWHTYLGPQFSTQWPAANRAPFHLSVQVVGPQSPELRVGTR